MREDPSDSLLMRSADRGRMEGAEKHAVNEGEVSITGYHITEVKATGKKLLSIYITRDHNLQICNVPR